MSNYLIIRLVCLLILAVLWAPPAIVQSSETKTRVDAIEAVNQGIVSILAGPSSVDGQ
ncbi:MAG: hypothetical protein KKD01_20075 [Proteobacteria bacterium]|nr:hypothetical protein [Pseudomonadota bacterium]MBU1457018.1 hypothetical protein [Pseudomonadota bacterium]